MHRRNYIRLFLVLFLASFGPRAAQANTPCPPAPCPPPDVLFEIRNVAIVRDTNINQPGADSISLAVSPTAAIHREQEVDIADPIVTGNTRVVISARGGLLFAQLESHLTSGSIPDVSRTLKLGSFGTSTLPAQVGLFVYVRGTPGTSYWSRGALQGRGDVYYSSGPSANVNRSAQTACCFVDEAPAPDSCLCGQSYELGQGLLTTGMPLLEYQGHQYRQVRVISLVNFCSGSMSTVVDTTNNWAVRAATDIFLEVGLNPAPGGGPSCPPFRLCSWNVLGSPLFQEALSSYGYAVGRIPVPGNCAGACPTGCFLLPGNRPLLPADVTADTLLARLVEDGLTPVLTPDPCPGGCVIAAVFRPGYDFHTLRLEADGTWSHKMGSLPVSCVDRHGNPITDPEATLMGGGLVSPEGVPYTEFLGYFCAPHDLRVVSKTPSGPEIPQAGKGSEAGWIITPSYSGLPSACCDFNAAADAELLTLLGLLTPTVNPCWTNVGPAGFPLVIVRSGTPKGIVVQGDIVGVQELGDILSYYSGAGPIRDWAQTHCGSVSSAGPTKPDPPSSGLMTVRHLPGSIFEIRLGHAMPGNANVEVLDLHGRRVRRIHDGPFSLEQVLRWRGDDDRGRLVASGVYWIRLRTEQGVSSRRVALLRSSQ